MCILNRNAIVPYGAVCNSLEEILAEISHRPEWIYPIAVSINFSETSRLCLSYCTISGSLLIHFTIVSFLQNLTTQRAQNEKRIDRFCLSLPLVGPKCFDVPQLHINIFSKWMHTCQIYSENLDQCLYAVTWPWIYFHKLLWNIFYSNTKST